MVKRFETVKEARSYAYKRILTGIMIPIVTFIGMLTIGDVLVGLGWFPWMLLILSAGTGFYFVWDALNLLQECDLADVGVAKWMSPPQQ